MLPICLHNFCLDMPILCLCVCACPQTGVSVWVKEQREMKVRASEKDPMRRTGILQGLWLFLHHYPNCRQSLLMSLFPSLTVHSLIHAYTHLLYVSTEADRGSCTAEKEKIREERRRRGRRERRMENRFMKWSIPNSTICLLWETPLINHCTAAENRAFGRVLCWVCMFAHRCLFKRESKKVRESFILTTVLSEQ